MKLLLALALIAPLAGCMSPAWQKSRVEDKAKNCLVVGPNIHQAAKCLAEHGISLRKTNTQYPYFISCWPYWGYPIVYSCGSVYITTAITRSQMVAAMVTLVLSVSLFALAFLADRMAPGGYWPAQALGYFAMFEQMRDFGRGVVDSRAIVFYLSLTFFLLFPTLRAVESRRWR